MVQFYGEKFLSPLCVHPALLVEEVEKEVDLALDQDPQSSHKEEVVTCNLMEHKAVFADSTTVQSELSEVSSSHQKQSLFST